LTLVLAGATPIGTPFLATEIASTGEYVANMPSTPYGKYLVLVTVGSGIKIGSGEIYWDGAYEMQEGLVVIQGLNPNSPSTTTPTSWTAGDIDITITGDGVNDTTMTRNP
jgi:hypothetical protein